MLQKLKLTESFNVLRRGDHGGRCKEWDVLCARK
jgi:hypothetical protein